MRIYIFEMNYIVVKKEKKQVKKRFIMILISFVLKIKKNV